MTLVMVLLVFECWNLELFILCLERLFKETYSLNLPFMEFEFRKQKQCHFQNLSEFLSPFLIIDLILSHY